MSSDVNATLGLLRELMRLDRGMSLREAVALLTVGLHPGLSLSELAWELDEPPYSASRAVSALAGAGAEGLVRVATFDANRRIRQVFPTAEGRRLLERWGIATPGRHAA
ncbi:MAG TPA: hypothetical protein VEB20_00105 [Azospirillaceae bacterium]|nr:hypothetical protein [Azospirillaceae bacterium]